jgi:hypothetical protein
MGITVRLKITGAHQTLAAFRRLPKEASKELRDANQSISEELRDLIRSAAAGSDKQSALMVPTIKSRRDRVPSIEAGGTRKVGRHKVPAYKLVYGSNFGATYLHQFRKHNGGAGSEDYWFFTTVEHNEARLVEQWTQAADRILNDWGSRG